MDMTMKMEVIEVATNELRGLLEEHMDTIDQSMQSMLAEHDKESEFTYSVAMGLKLTPRPDTTKVSAKISYSVKHSDETVGAVADPAQMKIEFGVELFGWKQNLAILFFVLGVLENS